MTSSQKDQLTFKNRRSCGSFERSKRIVETNKLKDNDDEL